MDADLKAYLEEMKRELREYTETVETRLLLEFWKWARQADARYRQHHGVVTGLDERAMLVEDRITTVERWDRAQLTIDERLEALVGRRHRVK